MIITIKEAAVLLNKLAQYTPDENVEIKFLEGENVRVQPKSPINALFAELTVRPSSKDNYAKCH